MSVGDFDSLTPDEFEAIAHHYSQMQESRLHDDWERARMLATIIVQPFCSKTMKAEDLLPLPWDTKKESSTPDNTASTEQRFNELVKFFEERDKDIEEDGK